MTRALFLFFLLAVGASAGPRQSVPATPGEWIQLTFKGRIEQAGGARVEFELGALAATLDGSSREVELRPHLAQYTTGSDLAALLAQRLERAEIDVWLSEATEESGVVRRHLFVERALFARLRLGHGLSASVTVCEGVPMAVRFEPPASVQEGAHLSVTFSTLHPHTKAHKREELSMPLAFDMHAARISEALTRRCLERGWVAERPRQDSWRLVRLGDGAGVVGFSLELESQGDWRIELEFDR